MPEIPLRLLRRIPVIIREVEKPIEKLAKEKGIWETLGGAVRFAGKWIGRPVAVGAGLLGLAHLGSIGVKEAREALGIETPEQKAEEQIRLQREALENAKNELNLYKEYLNMLRSAQIPGYQPYSMSLPFTPEWSPLKIPKNTEHEVRKGFDWTIALPIGGVALIAIALIFMLKGGKK